jgi:hypothetical protein
MKNVIMKNECYKDYGMFNHIYILDVKYDFNKKTVDDILNFVESDPFSPVMIHTSGFSLELIELLGKISKEIWFNSDNFLFEDFSVLDDKTIELFNIHKIDYMIDALGDEIDLKRSVVFNELIRYDNECPF